MPSLCLSGMPSRSAWPTAPMTASINLPGCGGRIEGLRARHRQDPQRDLLALQPGDDRQQVAHGPGEPIQICANGLVVLADVFEGLFKLAALGDRGDRLAENLVAPCAAKLALLRFQTCDAASKAVRLANKSAQ